LIRALDVYKEDLLSPEVRKKAYRLFRDIDETDAPHVAITLDIDGVLWTGDERLRAGLGSKGFDRFFEPSISGGEAG
jgi:predicted nucleic acid-binding protein